jgi:hypothetical protein
MRLQKWINTGVNGPVLPWNTTGEWIFYALTWDGARQTATIYQGTATNSAIVQRQFAVPEINTPIPGGGPAYIGNDQKNGGPGNRAFSGGIDDIRIYDKALDEKSIEAIRAADAVNIEGGLP